MSPKVNWNKLGDSEWIHFGTGVEIDKRIIMREVNKHFNSSSFYLAMQRNDSVQLERESLENEILLLLDKKDFLIWNIDFTKAIEFNHCGILRCGQIPSNNKFHRLENEFE